MDTALEQKIVQLPPAPGVYLMKDKAGRVFYVGKATDLRERLHAYLSGSDSRFFVPLLGQLLGDLETVVVANEKEALLLENELIRRYTPRFNVRPKEGKNFIYLRLDSAQRYPRLEVTRQVRNDGARYFGPYPLAHAVRQTLGVVNRHFKLRTCSDHDPATHRRPCLLCQIARFPAPSVYDIPPDEYRSHVAEAILFLEGKKTDLVESLRMRMEQAAQALRFEEAARLRDCLEAIERTLEPQKIVTPETLDQDAAGFHRSGKRFLVFLLFVRSGRVIGGRAFSFAGQAFPDRELFASFLNLYYESGSFVPDEILLPAEIEGMNGLGELLSERKGSKVRVLVPRRGGRRDLVEMCTRNAVEALGREPGETDGRTILARLQERLDLSRIPHRMECFDASHFRGETLVAAKVAMTDGQTDKARYRRYKIRSVRVGDDFAALYETLSRRLKRGLGENDLPDLLVIDGGKGQLACAQAALKDLGVSGVDVIALAKVRELEAEGEPYRRRRRTPERIFLVGRKEPVILPQDSPEMLLLARLRDEAHRFAIGYQRKLLRRERMHSELEHIPGIGTERRKALLRHFGSLKRVGQASIDELTRVQGVGPETARRIHEHFRAPP
jgi:excinuclease ABC subunit C